MKTKFSTLLITLAMTVLGSIAQANVCSNHNYDLDEIAVGLLVSTTVPPLTTTILIGCAGAFDHAQVNKAMIQKEATMLVEENKIYVPSFLGAYADRNNMDLREAAQDVLVNGVR